MIQKKEKNRKQEILHRITLQRSDFSYNKASHIKYLPTQHFTSEVYTHFYKMYKFGRKG